MRANTSNREFIQMKSNDSSIEMTEKTLPFVKQEQSAIVIESLPGDDNDLVLPKNEEESFRVDDDDSLANEPERDDEVSPMQTMIPIKSMSLPRS